MQTSNVRPISQYEDIDENKIEINLTTKETRNGKLNLPFSTIYASAEILANKLLDYARNGGDMSSLTPDKIFRRKGNKI